MSVSVYGFRLANGYGYYAVGDLKLDPFLDITMTSTGFNCSQSIFLKFNILFVGSGTHVAIVGGAITAILVVVAGILSVLLVSVLYIRRSRKINLVKNSIARYVIFMSCFNLYNDCQQTRKYTKCLERHYYNRKR